MSDFKKEIIEYLKLEKEVRISGLEQMDKNAEIPKRIAKEIELINKWLEYLENKSGSSFDYWKERCKLIELIEEESPCDPDITNDQIKAWKNYHNFIKKHGQR